VSSSSLPSLSSSLLYRLVAATLLLDGGGSSSAVLAVAVGYKYRLITELHRDYSASFINDLMHIWVNTVASLYLEI